MKTGERVEVDLGDDADIYLARVDWSADGSDLFVQRQNRAQTRLDLLAADPETGATRIVLTEQAPTWINLSDDLTPLDDGGYLWSSERTGYRHIFRLDPDGTQRQLTSGEWVVDEIAGIDEARGLVYFEGWMDTPLERHLYVVPLDASEAPRRITPGAGWWNVEVGDDGAAFIGTYSDPGTPPHTALYRIDGERIAWLVENRLDDTHPYGPYRGEHAVPEFGELTAGDGETALQWLMYRPESCTEASPCPRSSRSTAGRTRRPCAEAGSPRAINSTSARAMCSSSSITAAWAIGVTPSKRRSTTSWARSRSTTSSPASHF